MALELQDFASGDTDYIAKLNQNNSELIDALSAMGVQIAAVSGGDALTVGMFLDSLFNRADGLIGPGSYKPTQSASTLTIAPGGMYLGVEKSVVASFDNVPLTFSGAPAGTYYVVVNTAGAPMRSTTSGVGTTYSVVWTGSGFSGSPTQIAPILFDTLEADRARKSTAMNKSYATLDDRFEAVEVVAKQAATDANDAMSVAYETQAALGAVAFRKIGITVDGTVGVKGAIQIDFDGTIIGWSCIANVAGDLQVELSRKASSAPPSAPQVPNTTTDKITGTNPIQLSAQQTAARSDTGLSGWTLALKKWDVVQFNVASINTVSSATLYVRVQEDLPSPLEINPLESPVLPELEFREGDQ